MLTFYWNNNGLKSCRHQHAVSTCAWHQSSYCDHAARLTPKPNWHYETKLLPLQKGFLPRCKRIIWPTKLTMLSSSWVPLRHHAQNQPKTSFCEQITRQENQYSLPIWHVIHYRRALFVHILPKKTWNLHTQIQDLCAERRVFPNCKDC